jgi:hypothetical protein
MSRIGSSFHARPPWLSEEFLTIAHLHLRVHLGVAQVVLAAAVVVEATAVALHVALANVIDLKIDF